MGASRKQFAQYGCDKLGSSQYNEVAYYTELTLVSIVAVIFFYLLFMLIDVSLL